MRNWEVQPAPRMSRETDFEVFVWPFLAGKEEVVGEPPIVRFMGPF